MCGIVGLTSKKDSSKEALHALKKLEYRGYDSVGISTLTPNTKTSKMKGKVNDFIKKNIDVLPQGNTSIAHTRWATHGKPSKTNSHPISDNGISLVHNGIIENESLLRKDLIEKGHKFISETDTEVILRLLIESGKSVHDALPEVVNQLEGSFAIAILDEKNQQKIYFARKSSPLIIGVGKEEMWLSSDVNAILEKTREVCFLEDERWGFITPDEASIFTMDGKRESIKTSTIPWDPESTNKAGYPHFMLKEIFEQPRCLTDSMSDKMDLESIRFPENVASVLKGVKRIKLIACGTSYNATLAFKYWTENFANIPCEVEYASEARFNPVFKEDGLLVIAVSQSGETADTIKAAENYTRKKIPLLSIVNSYGSALERMSNAVLRTHAGVEIGVAATKTHITQLLTLYLISLHLSKEDNKKEKVQELRRLPLAIEKVLSKDGEIESIAKKYKDVKNVLFLGRQYSWPTALEGSLKLKEISYIHAEAYAAGEMKHGPIALVSEKLLSVIVANNDEHFEKVIGNLREISARKGQILLLTTEDAPEIKQADSTIRISSISSEMSSFCFVVVLQLISYHIAKHLGLDIDQPRNLAKTVTVE